MAAALHAPEPDITAGIPVGRDGREAAMPLAGVLESKPALPSREEDTEAAFAATACCNAIPDALVCCLSNGELIL